MAARRHYYRPPVDATGNDTIALHLGWVTRTLYERVPTEDGNGHMQRQVGTEEVEVVLEADPVKLRRTLGLRAATSSRGVANALHGAVKARVVARKKVPR